MLSARHAAAAAARWERIEAALARLHDTARTASSSREFYEVAATELHAAWPELSLAVWAIGQGSASAEIVADAGAWADESSSRARRRSAVLCAARGDNSDADDSAVAYAVVRSVAAPEIVAAVFEAQLTAGDDPVDGGEVADLVAAVATVASDVQALSELRRLQRAAAGERPARELERRLQLAVALRAAGYDIANDGRQILACDRVTVLVRRGARMRVLAASGVDHIEPRSAFARRIEHLASRIAAWGEPLVAGTAPTGGGEVEHPPALEESLAAFLDHSHARTLAAAPVRYPALVAPREHADKPTRDRPNPPVDALLVAEWFQTVGPTDAASRCAELADLCGPALARTSAVAGPIARRVVLRAARRGTGRRFAIPRWLVAGLIAAGVVATLTLVETDFEVEAPAVLLPAERYEVFAPTTGRVSKIRVRHGQEVAAGEILAVLDDPQLGLQWEQVVGELAAVNRRIESLAVARTERSVREQADAESLPPGAEQQQLLQKRSSLERQRDLLLQRRNELTLRSPIAGIILTRDVESLLASRPVERGQALLTVADPRGTWELAADVDQRDAGFVADELRELTTGVPTRFRLADDLEQIRTGRTVALDAAATLDVDDLAGPPPPIPARVAVDDGQLTAPRAGARATVRIHCGRRSLAYAWFHDLGAAVYRWWMF